MNAETPVAGVYPEGCIGGKIDIGEKEIAVLAFDENGMILNCNQAAATLLDCPARKLTGQYITRLLPKLIGINLL